jgi:glycosyltransferase involved in cell wall biosynthesis
MQPPKVPARVMLFVPSLEGGGTERAFMYLANGLASAGVEVHLVVIQATGAYLGSLSPSVQLVDLKQTSVSRAVPGLARQLRRVRPTALLAGLSHANVVAAIAHRVSGSRARLVLTEHAHLSSVLRQYRDVQTRMTQWLMRFSYPWADAVVSVSEGVKADLRHHVRIREDRSLVIYNPVVEPGLAARSAMTPSHPWLLGGDVPVVLAAGRLTPQKDFANLLEAFAVLRCSRGARLLILGEGELRDELLSQARRLGIAEDVSLPGFEVNPYAAMRAAQVFVLSSAFEGMSYVLVEAMACGTRVVSTDCPSGPSEVLEGGRWGPLVPVGDPHALAGAICRALDNPSPPDVRMRAADFSVERAVTAYARVLGLP